MRAVAFVLAGPSANRPFLGVPAVLRAIEAVSSSVERTLVVTDDPAVRSILPHGVECLDGEREIATYTAAPGFDAALLLRADAPLTRPEDVHTALARYHEAGRDALVSVVRLSGTLWGDDGCPKNGRCVENGALTILSRRSLLESGLRPKGGAALYEMPPETLLASDAVGWAAMEAVATGRRREAFDHEWGERLRRIRLVLSDVDGVMTDAGMVYGEGGDELKRFNTRDGKGFEIVRDLGLKTGIVTTENTALVARRAAKLRVDFLHQGVERKDESLAEICAALGIAPSEVAYIGDDVNDLSILARVGFAACPADAVEAVKGLAHHVCRAKGGEGAVRELCDLIAAAQGLPEREAL